MKPLFDLKKYFYPLFFYSLNPEYDEEKHQEPELMINASITDLSDDSWGISLSIKTPSDNKTRETFPLEFSILVLGVIESVCPDDCEPLTHKRLVYVNGASLLYSAARERLAMFYGQHSKPFLLPTYRFDPYDVKETNATVEDDVIENKKTHPQPKRKSKKTK